MDHFSIDTAPTKNGPWSVVDSLMSDRVIPVINEACELPRNQWIRVVRNDNEPEATIIRPIDRFGKSVS